MSTEKLYVLRILSYWYNDEHYSHLYDQHSHFGHIQSIFDDQDEALKQWKQLEYKFCHHPDIQFKHLIYEPDHVDDERYLQPDFLANLSVDALFAHLHTLNQCMHALYAYPIDQTVTVLKDCPIVDAQMEDDVRSNKFLQCYYAPEQRTGIAVEDELYLENATHTLHADLEILSDTPILLQKWIEQHPKIKYDAERKQLKIPLEPKTLSALNALLKIPIELSEMSLKRVFQYEKIANQEE